MGNRRRDLSRRTKPYRVLRVAVDARHSSTYLGT
jgi:hypothetical protein